MSLWNISVEISNGSHALSSITGEWIAHFLDLVEIPIACGITFAFVQSQMTSTFQIKSKVGSSASSIATSSGGS